MRDVVFVVQNINCEGGITHMLSETEGVKSSWELAVGLQSSGTFSQAQPDTLIAQ
jgi:hypothetical protein